LLFANEIELRKVFYLLPFNIKKNQRCDECRFTFVIEIALQLTSGNWRNASLSLLAAMAATQLVHSQSSLAVQFP